MALMNPGASAQILSGRVDVTISEPSLHVPMFMSVSLLSIWSVMMCVLVYMSNKPIDMFFTSLCVAMSAICGCVTGSCMSSVIGSGIYLEGRPIRSYLRFGPIKKADRVICFFSELGGWHYMLQAGLAMMSVSPSTLGSGLVEW